VPNAGIAAGCLAVVPARGGSKGIRRKNVQPVGGVPMVARAVNAALASRVIDRVVVSTDDDEIADAAHAAGAEVLRRPADISGDSARSEDALVHVLDELRASEGYVPEVLVMLQCTSPLLRPVDIDAVVDALHRDNADCALSVAPNHRFLWRADPERGARGVNHDATHRPLRQELEPEFVETGAVYAMKVDGFLQHRFRFFGRIALGEMPPERAFEVDDPFDLTVVRALHDELDREEPLDALPPSVGALVLDFDGVVTDDRVLTFQDGTEAVMATRADGLGVERLRALVPVVILSKERNPVVAARAKKLQVECLQGVDDKATALRDWAAANAVDLADVVYVANDINDLPCLGMVGCPVAVPDAYPEVLAAARIVLRSPGGRGAVREIAELILRKQGA
jgi:N-acylneuraminate cytidylyltransferase